MTNKEFDTQFDIFYNKRVVDVLDLMRSNNVLIKNMRH